MYIPKTFEVTDHIIIEQFIRENGFATLISMGNRFPVGTHIPVELEINEHGEKVLCGHLSKGNPQWKSLKQSPEVLVIFLSHVHSYISSSWYDQPDAPTWNYLSVHVTGRIKTIEGEKLWESIKKLTDKYERALKNPVTLDTLPKSVQKQINGVVGFEISIEKMEAAFKLSQNRSEKNFKNIIKELKLSNELRSTLMANVMESNRTS